MKKIAIVLILLLVSYSSFAQEKKEDDKPKEGWTFLGDFSVMFSQAAFNNDWQSGGTSNYAGDISLEYHANYKKDRLSWDNAFLGAYGLAKTKGDDFLRKTNDKLELHSVLGYQLKNSEHWYYSFFADFTSQFAKGYEYTDDVPVIDPVTGNVIGTETVREETTHFLSPGYLKFGPGILYKNGELLKMNIAPLTSRFIFVDDRFTTVPGYVDGDYYGVDQGKSTRFEFGASIDIFSTIPVMENVSIKNNLHLYANYLEDPQNVDIDYTMKLDMKINKFLSANFVFQAVYDDNAVAAFQIREVLGVGFNYKL